MILNSNNLLLFANNSKVVITRTTSLVSIKETRKFLTALEVSIKEFCDCTRNTLITDHYQFDIYPILYYNMVENNKNLRKTTNNAL